MCDEPPPHKPDPPHRITRTVDIDIAPAYWDQLERLAQRTGIPVEHLIEHALSDFILHQHKKP